MRGHVADEEDSEETYDLCDNCGKYGTVIGCPSCGEQIKYVFVPKNFCEECCDDLFDFDPEGCLQNFGDCPRVEHVQLARIKKLAEKANLKKSGKIPEFFLNSEETLAVGGYNADPKKISKGKMLPVDVFYEGTQYDFAGIGKNKYAYSKALIDQALSILKEAGEEETENMIMSESGSLVIQGNLACSVIAHVDIEWPYSSEQRDFIEKVRSGYAIFEENVKKEIRLIDLAELKLDWSRLDPNQFEELCCAVLCSFGSISNCVKTGATGDEGRDIKATEKVETFTGFELRKLVVQCKHHPNGSVGRKDIEDLKTLHARFKFDVYCVMTSGTFSPSAMRLLEEYEKGGFIIKYMDRRFLEYRIRLIPTLLEQFPELSE
jgi:hypothetical protein